MIIFDIDKDIIEMFSNTIKNGWRTIDTVPECIKWIVIEKISNI